MEPTQEYDVIVVGSGAGGATVAREMARRGKSVLVLERGGAAPARDGLRHLAAVSDYVPVSDGAGVARAITVGGTTAVYFGVAEYPPLQAFRQAGIDLSAALEEARRELPLVEPLSDRLLGAQVRAVRDGAAALGVPWMKTEAMMIDESKCGDGFSHDAIWRARLYVDEAVGLGAKLVTGATVRKALTRDGRAIGVEYMQRIGRRSELRQAYGRRVVMAAGALATPSILRASGLRDVGQRGFYCDPGFLIVGHVKGLKGRDFFPGTMGTNSEEDGILVGDGCLSRSLYRGYMLANRQFRHLFRHGSHVAIAVMVRDGLGGELRDDGRLHKAFTAKEKLKLEKGGELAERIARSAGARGLVRSDLSAAHVGGLVELGKQLDDALQTEIENLHVCDCSLLPANVRLTPVFTLVCLGKYLGGKLDRLL